MAANPGDVAGAYYDGRRRLARDRGRSGGRRARRPHLAAIAPQRAVTSEFYRDVWYVGGQLSLTFGATWASLVQGSNAIGADPSSAPDPNPERRRSSTTRPRPSRCTRSTSSNPSTARSIGSPRWSTVAMLAEAEGHHPDIELGWGRAAFSL